MASSFTLTKSHMAGKPLVIHAKYTQADGFTPGEVDIAKSPSVAILTPPGCGDVVFGTFDKATGQQDATFTANGTFFGPFTCEGDNDGDLGTGQALIKWTVSGEIIPADAATGVDISVDEP